MPTTCLMCGGNEVIGHKIDCLWYRDAVGASYQCNRCSDIEVSTMDLQGELCLEGCGGVYERDEELDGYLFA
jgi:hypothetical protein